MLLTGSELERDEACRAGFAVPVSGGDAMEGLLAWYRTELAPLSAFALRETVAAGRRGSGLVEVLGAGLDAAERHYLDRIVSSHDGNEGIDAFLERRAPRWEDA
jgi:enoyl-CoA hydratase/carnithine racemase